ncbi:MAG: XrtA/PEP-CTERM system histidine kinase PrsK, partial [Gammaproteobacteria bacterium]
GMVMLLRPPKLPSLNWEDYDLLRVGGRQAAAHLAQYNAALALSEAKQFEASSRKSAYVMHDLKNLIAQLSLIVSNAEKHKNNPVFMDDVIQTVDNSVNKMNRLIEKLNDGVGDKSKERINLCGLLHDVAQTMSGGLPRPSVDCQASGLLANADPDRFAAIIGHLIRNAQDATDDTGGIIVRLFKQRDKAIIEVQDDGSGMEKAFIRDELFKPFSTTKGKQGMGIGAHEVRDLVYKMGGDVEVISRPNEGTTFRIIIPRIAESDKIV